MYSNKKIPAPFAQPRQNTSRKEQTAGEMPAPTLQKKFAKTEPVPIMAEEKGTPQKATQHNAFPLLALAFLELFSQEK